MITSFNDVWVDPPEIVQDKSDQSNEVMKPVANSLNDTAAATDKKVMVHLVHVKIYIQLGY